MNDPSHFDLIIFYQFFLDLQIYAQFVQDFLCIFQSMIDNIGHKGRTLANVDHHDLAGRQFFTQARIGADNFAHRHGVVKDLFLTGHDTRIILFQLITHLLRRFALHLRYSRLAGADCQSDFFAFYKNVTHIMASADHNALLNRIMGLMFRHSNQAKSQILQHIGCLFIGLAYHIRHGDIFLLRALAHNDNDLCSLYNFVACCRFLINDLTFRNLCIKLRFVFYDLEVRIIVCYLFKCKALQIRHFHQVRIAANTTAAQHDDHDHYNSDQSNHSAADDGNGGDPVAVFFLFPLLALCHLGALSAAGFHLFHGSSARRIAFVCALAGSCLVRLQD